MSASLVLETRGLTKQYGALTAVADLSLAVQEGEILGFLGPNGAGKTTSINMMCGLLRPDSGQVLIHGLPVQGGDRKIRTRVGVCPQETIVWDKLTCLEQLEFMGEMYALPRKQARRRALELLERVELREKARELGSRLSGGMRRRLNLILALVHDPEVLVLDEPEAGLDPQSRVLVREYIRSLARRKTVILTTQNMDEAERLADRVAIIDHGRLLVVDTPEALKGTVGEGDILELEMEGHTSRETGEVLRRFELDISLGDRNLSLRGRGVVKHLNEILEALEAAGAPVKEVRLRSCTLEDVFLALTGRRLRE